MNRFYPLILTAGTLLFISACNQVPNDVQNPSLETLYGTPYSDSASFVVTNENGYLYTLGGVTGNVEFDGGEVVLKRFSPSGQELWSRRLLSCSNLCGVDALGAGIDAAGNSYALSIFYGADVDPFTTLYKVSPTGEQLWSQEVSGSSMATSVSGETFIASSNQHLTKYSSSGQLLFEVPLVAPASSLAVASDGSLYTFGEGKVVKYSGRGTLLWQQVVPFASDNFLDLAVSGTSVYLSGNTYADSGARIRLYKYTGGGTLVWQRSITPFGRASVLDLSADASGNVYLGGATNPDETDFDLFVRKYTPSGSVAWTYTPDLRGTAEVANGVSAADSGRVYVVGSTDGKVNGKNFGGQDAFLLRLDTAGKKVWSR